MLSVGISGLIGYEAALSLFEEHRAELSERFSSLFIDDLKKLSDDISKNNEGEDVCAAQDLEGVVYRSEIFGEGFFSALWEMTENLKNSGAVSFRAGFYADIKDIPVEQEITEILDYLGEDPYTSLSGGVKLFVWDEDKAGKHIPGVRTIGYITKDAKRIIKIGDSFRYLTPPLRLLKDTEYRKNLSKKNK